MQYEQLYRQVTNYDKALMSISLEGSSKLVIYFRRYFFIYITIVCLTWLILSLNKLYLTNSLIQAAILAFGFLLVIIPSYFYHCYFSVTNNLRRKLKIDCPMEEIHKWECEETYHNLEKNGLLGKLEYLEKCAKEDETSIPVFPITMVIGFFGLLLKIDNLAGNLELLSILLLCGIVGYIYWRSENSFLIKDYKNKKKFTAHIRRFRVYNESKQQKKSIIPHTFSSPEQEATKPLKKVNSKPMRTTTHRRYGQSRYNTKFKHPMFFRQHKAKGNNK